MKLLSFLMVTCAIYTVTSEYNMGPPQTHEEAVMWANIDCGCMNDLVMNRHTLYFDMLDDNVVVCMAGNCMHGKESIFSFLAKIRKIAPLCR